MKQIVLSGLAALVLTTGIAVAESDFGADQTLYQSIISTGAAGVTQPQSVGTTFDGHDKDKLPSVQIDADKQPLGVR